VELYFTQCDAVPYFRGLYHTCNFHFGLYILHDMVAGLYFTQCEAVVYFRGLYHTCNFHFGLYHAKDQLYGAVFVMLIMWYGVLMC
jgi:hypothetical protein